MTQPKATDIHNQRQLLETARETLEAEQRDLQAIAENLKAIEILKANNAKLKADNEARLSAYTEQQNQKA